MNEPIVLPDAFAQYFKGHNLDERAVTFIDTANINQLKAYQGLLSQLHEEAKQAQVKLKNIQSTDTLNWSTFVQPIAISAAVGGVGGGLLGFINGSSALLAQGCGAGLLFGCFWGTGKTVLRNVRKSEAGFAEISEEDTAKRSYALLTIINNRLNALSAENENVDTNLRQRNVSPG